MNAGDHLGATVEIDLVSKSFPNRSSRVGDYVALSSISADVPAGQFVAVVGPSGCGKSTLLNIVSGLETPSAGSVSIDTATISGPRPDVGVVFQEYALFPWLTVRSNIGFGPRAAKLPKNVVRDRVRDLIAMVGLTGFEDHYPGQLSGGMRQRCALARTLANEPRLLLMDEPLGSVDAQTRTVLQDEILRIWGEELEPAHRRTVVFVTHDIDEAVYLSDRIIVLTGHPGAINEDITNTLPRPRRAMRHSGELGRLSDHIWDLIRGRTMQR